MSQKKHDLEFTYWDNIGFGWRMECSCGFCTLPDKRLEEVGADMDDHFEEVGLEFPEPA